MKHSFLNRALALLLALVCVMGVLPLSAFAATGLSNAPSTITQKSSDYMYSGGKPVRYEAASSAINSVGRPFVFDEQVDVPGFGATRALCAYQQGTLGQWAEMELQQGSYPPLPKGPAQVGVFQHLRQFHPRGESRRSGNLGGHVVRPVVPYCSGHDLVL